MKQPSPPQDAESICAVLTRLGDILIEENALLESGKTHDHQYFINGKNQILRDLTVCQRTMSGMVEVPIVREKLVGVRALIDRNHSLLRSHVQAMTQLTSLLTEVEIAEDADGTYDKYSV